MSFLYNYFWAEPTQQNVVTNKEEDVSLTAAPIISENSTNMSFYNYFWSQPPIQVPIQQVVTTNHEEDVSLTSAPEITDNKNSSVESTPETEATQWNVSVELVNETTALFNPPHENKVQIIRAGLIKTKETSGMISRWYISYKLFQFISKTELNINELWNTTVKLKLFQFHFIDFPKYANQLKVNWVPEAYQRLFHKPISFDDLDNRDVEIMYEDGETPLLGLWKKYMMEKRESRLIELLKEKDI